MVEDEDEEYEEEEEILVASEAESESGDDDLGDAKVKSMFDAVDTNSDVKIAFVKYYQACNDEAIARRPNPFAGLFGGKK